MASQPAADAGLLTSHMHHHTAATPLPDTIFSQLQALINTANITRPFRLFRKLRVEAASDLLGGAGDERWIFWLTEASGQIVGTASLMPSSSIPPSSTTADPATTLVMNFVAVSPPWQGRGLGQRLCTDVERHVRRTWGGGRLVVYTVREQGNDAYYGARGYAAVAEEACPAGQWAAVHGFTLVTMVKVVE